MAYLGPSPNSARVSRAPSEIFLTIKAPPAAGGGGGGGAPGGGPGGGPGGTPGRAPDLVEMDKRVNISIVEGQILKLSLMIDEFKKLLRNPTISQKRKDALEDELLKKRALLRELKTKKRELERS